MGIKSGGRFQVTDCREQKIKIRFQIRGLTFLI
jgi:hypothetical protein